MQFLKTSFLLLSTLILFSQCAINGILREDEDVFRGESRNRLETTAAPIENRTGVCNVNNYYVHTSGNGGTSDLTLYTEIVKETENFVLEPEIYIQIDKHIIKKRIERLDQGMLPESESNADNPIPSLNIALNNANNGAPNRDYFRLHFDEDDIEKIRRGLDIRFRYYYGPHTVTIRVNRVQMEKLKRLVSGKM